MHEKELVIYGKPVSFWVKKYDLPVHLYSAEKIRSNLQAFKNVFAKYYPNARVCFAAKACTHKPVLKIVNSEKCGADVASYNETRCALEAGIPPEMLDLNGNCKEDFLIKEAIQKGMNIIADSLEEFKQVALIALQLKKKPRVILRVSGFELGEVTADNVFTAGLWTKFGVPLKEVPPFLHTLDNYPSVELIGFHAHIGSQIAQIEPYRAVLGKFIELGKLLIKTGRPCRVINIGGGFPICYISKKHWENICSRIREGYLKAASGDMSRIFVWHDALAGFISEAVAKIHLEKWTGERFYTPYPKEKMLEALLISDINVEGKLTNAVQALKAIGEPLLCIEPGRSVVEDAGVTLAKISIVRKVAGDHNLITIEMGITSHGESLIERPVKRWEIANDYTQKEPLPFETFVGGNLCFSGDMISKYKVFLQRKPKRGDVLLIHDTGAYSSSLLAANSNSYPRPARVMMDESGITTTLKKRDRYRDIFG
ncbi:MAG: alanine racemase [Candidatus Margulisiibacteriota bacterium]